jgi:hypothetical protein
MLNGYPKTYHPDMEAECHICGRSPCVVVYDLEIRRNSETELCGPHFFNDRAMVEWEKWNDPKEASE